MSILLDLTESKMFSSKTSYKKYTGKEITELAYLHMIALRIISCEKDVREDCLLYTTKSKRDHFHKWQQSSSDLYLLLHAIFSEDDLGLSDKVSDYIEKLKLDEERVTSWFNSIISKNGMSHTYAQRLFITLDITMKITDTTLKSIRRLAMNWDDLERHEKKITVTRLLQIMRQRCRQSDILVILEKLAKKKDLELDDVCNIETGDGCNSDTSNHSDVSLAKLSHIMRSRLQEDGDAVATTSVDIAPYVKPLGDVKRRNPK